jgi:hypothetical protein
VLCGEAVKAEAWKPHELSHPTAPGVAARGRGQTEYEGRVRGVRKDPDRYRSRSSQRGSWVPGAPARLTPDLIPGRTYQPHDPGRSCQNPRAY